MLRVHGKLADSQSIITKADLLKPRYQGINGTMILPYSEGNRSSTSSIWQSKRSFRKHSKKSMGK